MNDELDYQAFLERWRTMQQGGMLNMTDAERAALMHPQLEGQRGLPQQAAFGLQGHMAGPLGGLLFGNPWAGAAPTPTTWFHDVAWKPPEIIYDPPAWVGWSYIWPCCCAVGALGAWVAFVLFLCWMAR